MAPLVPPGYAYASIACAFASFQHNMTRMDLVQTASKAYTGGIFRVFSMRNPRVLGGVVLVSEITKLFALETLQ